jgi:drug/metabolite transporter (DMT)-like permease
MSGEPQNSKLLRSDLSDPELLDSDDEPIAAPEAGSIVAEERTLPESKAIPSWKRFVRGPGGMVGSSLAFAAMNFIVKVASASFPSGEIVFARFLFGTIFLGALGGLGIADIRARNRRLLITRGILGSTAIVLLFLALSKTSLTNAALLANTYILFGALFSLLFLGEGLGPKVVIALLVALSGAAFVVRPDFHHIQVGDMLALAHGVIGGAAVTVVRSLRRAGNESPWGILFYLSLVGLAAGPLAQPTGWAVPHGYGLLLLVSLGVLGTLGQGMMTYAYRWCTTAEGGILAMLVVPISTGLGVVGLGERLSAMDWFGASLILFSSAYVVLDRR